MAYVDQSLKAKIANNLKSVVPADWKYSLSVQNGSTIVMTVYSAPFDLIGAFRRNEWFDPATAKSLEVNPYHYRDQIEDECVADVLDKVFGALNTDNYDRSDSMTDYFDVGHYVKLRLGTYLKPFLVTGRMGAHR